MMMNDDRKITEEKIAELRRRSASGFLNQRIHDTLPRKIVPTELTEEDYQALVASVLGD